MNAQFAEAVRTEIARVKSESFVDGYEATDEEALGIALSQYSEWDGLFILRTAEYALEDANFHTESAIVGRMAEHVEAGEPQPDVRAGLQEVEQMLADYGNDEAAPLVALRKIIEVQA